MVELLRTRVRTSSIAASEQLVDPRPETLLPQGIHAEVSGGGSRGIGRGWIVRCRRPSRGAFGDYMARMDRPGRAGACWRRGWRVVERHILKRRLAMVSSARLAAVVTSETFVAVASADSCRDCSRCGQLAGPCWTPSGWFPGPEPSTSCWRSSLLYSTRRFFFLFSARDRRPVGSGLLFRIVLAGDIFSHRGSGR